MSIHNSQDRNEWYTPAKYTEAARIVMGGIDLDPASSIVANQIVKADRFYTKEDNGLEQPWYGKIWLNPPYGRSGKESNIGLFTTKLIREYRSGNIEQGILLSTPRPDTSWFPLLWEYPICFVDHGIAFFRLLDSKLTLDNKHTGHFFGTIFVYLGPFQQKFIDVFSQFGTVAIRADPSKVRIAATTLELWTPETVAS